MPKPEIVVSAVCFRDEDGRILAVRKRGTTRFMQPGGKPEPGEDARGAAVREVHEELGLSLDRDALVDLGVFRAVAANEPGHVVVAHTFLAHLPGEPVAAAEIAELRWIDPDSPDLPVGTALAPLFEHHLIPAIRALP